MKFKLLISFILILVSSSLFAGEPIISSNVHVIKNAHPEDCKATWSGSGPPVEVQSNTGYGPVTTIVPGILTCSNCAFDQNSGDCVCQHCQEDYN